MTEPLVRMAGITQRYGAATVLDDVSMEIARGEFTVLLGPSGSGKTTLLNILGGFLVPSAGDVLIDGKDMTAVPPATRPTATVFQDYALFPHMTVGDNVGFGLRMRGLGRAERQDKAQRALEMVGLPEAFGRKPHQLSGGQRQRVALARSLVVEPVLLLLDEPLGALDLKLRRHMQDELKALQRRVGTTFVHVTHDQEEAMAIADRIVVMNNGRIEDAGPPQRIYMRPATRFTALFMGESNILEGKVSAANGGRSVVSTILGQVEAEGTRDIGATVSLAVRPEHILIGAPVPQGWRECHGITLIDTLFQGDYVRARVALRDGTELMARAPQDVSAATATRVTTSFNPSRVVLLND